MPPKKRKATGKGKLAKMSEEERAEYLRQQLLKEEQTKRQKEELISMFMKEKAVREEKMIRHNEKKIQFLWIKIMREEKYQSLQKEVDSLAHEFEKQVDRKDFIIKNLMADLDHSEEQQMMRMRRYAESLDELIDLQSKRLLDLETAFETELDGIQTEFDEERELMKQQHMKDLSNEADIRFCVRTKFSKEEEMAQEEFQMECDELKNKNLEDKHSLRILLEQQLADMWEEFKKNTKDYQECTQERRQQYDTLKERDQKISAEIEEQGRRIKQLEKKIDGCRRHIKSSNQVATERQMLLKEQKTSLLSQFQDMKGYMAQFSQAEMRKLKRLCELSEGCIKDVDGKLKLGEEIVELAEICRRYETEEEKILPFYTTDADAVPEEEYVPTEANPSLPQGLRTLVNMSEVLSGFWRRYNKVKLDELAMAKDLDLATEENVYLQQTVQQYLNGYAVNPEVMASPNPLMVVTKSHVEQKEKFIPSKDALKDAKARAEKILKEHEGKKVVIEAAQAVRTMTLA